MSLSVDNGHSTLVPDRWSPTGWKFLNQETKQFHLHHPNKRNYIRTRPNSLQSTWKSDFRTTTALTYCDYQYPQSRLTTAVPSLPPAESPVKHSKSESMGSPAATEGKTRVEEWPCDSKAAAFHKKKHLDSGWFRMHLSGGTIR